MSSVSGDGFGGERRRSASRWRGTVERTPAGGIEPEKRRWERALAGPSSATNGIFLLRIVESGRTRDRAPLRRASGDCQEPASFSACHARWGRETAGFGTRTSTRDRGRLVTGSPTETALPAEGWDEDDQPATDGLLVQDVADPDDLGPRAAGRRTPARPAQPDSSRSRRRSIVRAVWNVNDADRVVARCAASAVRAASKGAAGSAGPPCNSAARSPVSARASSMSAACRSPARSSWRPRRSSPRSPGRRSGGSRLGGRREW